MLESSYSWSTGIGRWMGLNIRIHAALVIVSVLAIAIEINSGRMGLNILPGTAIATVFIAWISILLHEFTHIFVLNSLGGRTTEVTLMPWGGGTEIVPEGTPPANRAIIYLGGPTFNLTMFLMGGFLLTQTGHASWGELMNLFRPIEFEFENAQISIIKIAAWINFQLGILNLIPCYPFDGGQLIRALATSIAMDSSKIRVESTIMLIGTAVGLTSIGFSFFVWEQGLGPGGSGWIFLLVGGIMLLYFARHSFYQELSSPETWGENNSVDQLVQITNEESLYSNFDFTDDSENAIYSQWLKEKQEERLQELAREEEEEDRLADAILAKLHDSGIVSLTKDERELLDRVSARIRKRRRQQGV